MPVDVADTTAVGLKKMKITVEVAVGSGVSVNRGVAVKVAVGDAVGIAAEVWLAAATEVCAMNVLTALGSIVGMTGAAVPGTQAITSANARNQNRNLACGFFIFSRALQQVKIARWMARLVFDLDRHVGKTQLTFYHPDHYISAQPGRRLSIDDDLMLFPWF